MIGLFSSDDSEDTISETLSKHILDRKEIRIYESHFESLREDLQELNTGIKLDTVVEGFEIPSASHDYEDLRELENELVRVRDELRSEYPVHMQKDKIWGCTYCLDRVNSLQKLLDLQHECMNVKND